MTLLRRLAATTGAAALALSGLALTAPAAVAAPAPPSADIYDVFYPTMGTQRTGILDLRGLILGRFGSLGLTCNSVPLTGGGTASNVTMVVTSDSSKRVADVFYFYRYGVGLSDFDYLPLGEGKVMVVQHTETRPIAPAGIETVTAERTGPPASQRDKCGYSSPSHYGTAEVVHLTPIKRPTLAYIEAQCAEQAWYTAAPQFCPTQLATK